MFDKYLKVENLDSEAIEKAYRYLKEYCDENKTTVKKLLKDSKNIEPAATYIHSKLPFTVRMILNKEKIQKLITDNYDFIKAEAKKFEKK